MKLHKIFAVSFVLFVFFALPTLTADSISVVVDNNPVVFDTPPVIDHGQLIVPLKAVAEAIGMNVKYGSSYFEGH